MSTHLNFATSRFRRSIRFVLVNSRVPRTDQHCALCGGVIEKGYVRDSQTLLIYCDTQCFAGSAHEAASVVTHVRSTQRLTPPRQLHGEGSFLPESFPDMGEPAAQSAAGSNATLSTIVSEQPFPMPPRLR
jgi:hypothetical protein